MHHAGGGLGTWLVETSKAWERQESEWLLSLVEFDRSEAWAADGQLSCAKWMVWKLGMARSTAFEKLRVAYALERRPVLLEAFQDGRLSYSVLRLITAIDDPEEHVDQALILVATAEGASIYDVERVVRLYKMHRDQELPPPDPDLHRQVSVRRNVGEGLSRVTITLTDVETEEFLRILKAFEDPLFRTDAAAARTPVDESAKADTSSTATDHDDDQDDDDQDRDGEGGGGPAATPNWKEAGTRKARRADAFMNLLASSLSGDGRRAVGDDRYMVHVVKVIGGIGATTLDGEPLSDSTVDTIACDCSKVTHLVTDAGEPLHLGRRSREWSTAQRRAVAVRDGGHCRFPGCTSRFVDIHHIQWWERQGPTDVDNAMNCCRRHHTLIHAKGFGVEGDPNDELRFTRKDGTLIGVTYPSIHGRLRFPIAG